MPSSMNWADGSTGGTPLSAANLNKLAVVADVGTSGTPTGDALKATYVAKGAQFINVVDYGADPTFATSSTTAFNNALSALSAGGTLFIPPGKYQITGQLTVSKAVTICGASLGDDTASTGSVLITTSAWTGALFSVTAPYNVTFRDLNITNYDTFANTTAHPLTAISFTTGRSHAVQRCRVSSFYNNVDFQNCDFQVVTDSVLVKAVNYDLRLANAGNPDSGDGFVANNWIGGDTTGGTWISAACIRQESGGGTKFVNNKILGGAIGWQLAVPTAVATSDSLFSNNSFEAQTSSAIDVTIADGTSGWSNIVIDGNQFLGNQCTGSAVINFHASVAGQIQRVSITDNVITGASSSVDDISVDAVTEFTIANNTINGGRNGIVLGSLCRNWRVPPGNHITSPASAFIKNGAYYQWQWSENSSCDLERSRYVFNTSTSTPYSVAAIGLPNASVAVLEVIFSGQVAGGTTPGACGGVFQRLIAAPSNGATLTATTVGADTTTGAPFVMNFTISGGAITVSVQRSASDGGAASVQGTCYVRVRGAAYSI